MIRSRRLVMLLAWIVIALAALPLHAAERTLLHRSFPTDVSWGEISIAEGPQVELPKGDDRVTYRFSLAIVCNQRERREDVREATGQAVETPMRRRGAVYLAAELPEGREAWKGLEEKLRERLGGLTPETFGTFAQRFPSALIGAKPIFEGAFEAATCMTVDGQSDQAWTVRRVIDKKEGSVSAGSSGLSDPRPICSKLVAALEGEPASAVLASRFEIRALRDESLGFDEVATTGRGPVPWPEGAGIAYGPAPEGATAYTNTGANNGDDYRYEELRQARRGGPPETTKPYLLKAKVKSATIPVSVLDDDVHLSRWTWRVRDLQLGTEPSSNDVESMTLDVAFLFTDLHGQVDGDGVARAVAREFAASDAKPGVPLLQSSVRAHLRDLGPDALVAAFCDAATPREATFCVAGACAPLTNAEEFCRALGARLDRP